RSVPARPAVEGVWMTEDREVVDRDDDRDASHDGAAVGRTVEHVERPGRTRQRERVPERVAREVPATSGASEAELLDEDVGTSSQLAQEPRDVARRPCPGLRERRDVHPDPHGHNASAYPCRWTRPVSSHVNLLP